MNCYWYWWSLDQTVFIKCIVFFASKILPVMASWFIYYLLLCPKNNLNITHKNRACHGWSRCNEVCLISVPDIWRKKAGQIPLHLLLCSHDRFSFLAEIRIIFGVCDDLLTSLLFAVIVCWLACYWLGWSVDWPVLWWSVDWPVIGWDDLLTGLLLLWWSVDWLVIGWDGWFTVVGMVGWLVCFWLGWLVDWFSIGWDGWLTGLLLVGMVGWLAYYWLWWLVDGFSIGWTGWLTGLWLILQWSDLWSPTPACSRSGRPGDLRPRQAHRNGL